jgi:hypothetical protein
MKPTGFVKCRAFLDQLSDSKFFKKDYFHGIRDGDPM